MKTFPPLQIKTIRLLIRMSRKEISDFYKRKYFQAHLTN